MNFTIRLKTLNLEFILYQSTPNYVDIVCSGLKELLTTYVTEKEEKLVCIALNLHYFKE